ncbi:MAG TPA: hypothetical protein VMD97_06045 [Candidatus Aquilonibacter sp.]|nr:hypothetical protein [Candidatus Aquilonibacter sp.]
MKSLVQYLVALLLVLLGILVLCNPPQPAKTTTVLRPTHGDNSQVAARPGFHVTMKLA